MADQKLNEIPQVQSSELANVKAFFALMANGEIRQMSKEDMASVVGELLFSWKTASIQPSNEIELEIKQGLFAAYYPSGSYNVFCALLQENNDAQVLSESPNIQAINNEQGIQIYKKSIGGNWFIQNNYKVSGIVKYAYLKFQ